MSSAKLFESYKLGAITLKNRVVMAPLTRNRAVNNLAADALTAEYYAQRASAGLIITEASQISQQGQGYQDTPGIYNDEQIAGWRKVTDAVHAKGGKIFIQLWHVGRISHATLQPGGGAPVSPSAIRANAKTFVDGQFVDTSEPRELGIDEIPALIADYRKAAANAIKAGFDGVEVHAANGYLLEQFARDSLNKRTDEYGGSIQNRARLTLEVTKAIVEEIGAERTGIRLSPASSVNDLALDSDPTALANHLVDGLNDLNVAYIHIVEGSVGGARDAVPFDFPALRKRVKGTYIANNSYDLALANSTLDADNADLIAFGRPFIANPDLVERLKAGAELNSIDKATLYGGGAKGYTDYPTLAQASQAAE